jgi:GxxExxY protein
MHPKYERANMLSKETIGAAIDVHRVLGPGLIESIYEKCMMRELQLRRVSFVSQAKIPIKYKGAIFEEYLKFDLYVGDCLMVELKAVDAILPVHKAQML